MILLAIALGILLIGLLLGTSFYEHGGGDWLLNVGGWMFTFGIFLLVVAVVAGFGGKLFYIFDNIWAFIIGQIHLLRAM